MYKVIGLRVEKYIGQEVSGHNCDFTYTDVELERHVLLMVEQDTAKKVELTLWQEDGECGSGWCTATFGCYSWDTVNNFAGKHYTCDFNLDITERELDCEDEITTELFKFSGNGGCGYYPSGYYDVFMDKFTPV